MTETTYARPWMAYWPDWSTEPKFFPTEIQALRYAHRWHMLVQQIEWSDGDD